MTSSQFSLPRVVYLVTIATIALSPLVRSSCEPSAEDLIEELQHACDVSHVTPIDMKYGYPISCNDIFQKSDPLLKRAPKIKYEAAVEDATYTLLMVDPDAPGKSLNKLKFFIHWAVTDIKGSDLRTTYKGLQNARELIDYTSPAPPKGTHRYQFLLFHTTGQVAVGLPTRERSFALMEFLKHNSQNACDLVGKFQFKVGAE